MTRINVGTLIDWDNDLVFQRRAALFTSANSEYLSRVDNAFLSVADIDFAFCGWIYFTSLTGVQSVISKWNGVDANYEYRLLKTSAHKLHWLVNGGSLVHTTVLSAATWYFYVVWHDATANTINVQLNNGAAESAAFATGGVDGTGTFFLGREGPTQADYPNVRMAGVGMWKRLLTADERTALWNNGFGVPYNDLTDALKTSLQAYWNLDEASGTRNDSYTNALHLTDNNTVTNHDGVLTEDYENVSTRTAARSPVSIERGRNQISALAPPMASEIRFLLRNNDRRFSPENTGSVIYGNMEPNRLTRVYARDGDTGYNLATGFIDSLRQRTEPTEKSVEVVALGPLSRLVGAASASRGIHTPLYQTIRTDQMFAHILNATRIHQDWQPDLITGLQLWHAADRGVKSGHAAQFTRANSEYLSRADEADLSVGDVAFWLACWVYLDTKANEMGIASKWAAGNLEYLLYYDSVADRFKFSVRNTADNTTTTATADVLGAVSTATWYFVLAYHDQTNDIIGIRVNAGAADTTATSGGVRDGTAAFEVGRHTAGNYFDGRVDALAIGKPTGAIADIIATIQTQLYNSGTGRRNEEVSSANKTTWGLIEWWDLEEASGNRTGKYAATPKVLTDNATVTQANGVALSDAVDGDPIRQWNDLSGNARHATQSTSASKPTLQTNERMSQPVVRFDGADDYLDMANSTALDITGDLTIVAVVKRNTTTTADTILASLATAGRDQPYALSQAASVTTFAFEHGTASASETVTSTGTVAGGSYGMVTVVRSSHSIMPVVSGATETAPARTLTPTAGGSRVRSIGRYSAATPQYYDGDIAEIIIYDKALSIDERMQVEQYLALKWNIHIADSDDRDLETGLTTLAFGWAGGDNAFDLARKVLVAEGPGANIVERGNGGIAFEDRHFRLLTTRANTSQVTFVDDSTDSGQPISAPFSYDPRQRDVINRATYTYKLRTAKASAQVWALGSTVTLAANETRRIPATNSDPFTAVVVPSEAGGDFTVSAGSLSEVYLIGRSGTRVTIVLTAGSSGATITGLRLRAQLASVDNTIEVANTVDTAASQREYGLHEYPLDGMSELSDLNVAYDLCNAVVRARQLPVPTTEITVKSGSAGRVTQIVSREISDRVTLQEDHTGLNHQFMVEKINLAFASGGLISEARFGLERADDTQYWVLGTSELGTDTILGF